MQLPHVPARQRECQPGDEECAAGGRCAWGVEPDWYRSSPIAQRPFCAACGTSLGFRYDSDTDQMDLAVAAFDDPSRFKPNSHFGAESIHEAWIDTSKLPRTRTDEYQKLVDRWANAEAAPPDENSRSLSPKDEQI